MASDLPLLPRRIDLLGGVRVDGAPVAGEKVVGLLACLALNSSIRHSREMLADLLWPGLPSGQARRSLSDLLYRLRQLLGPVCIIADVAHLGLNPDAVRTDVADFARLSGATNAADLQQAIELYAGPLAPEIYDDWILPRRVSLHESYLDALARLGALAEADGRFDLALTTFRQLAEAEPLHEVACCGIMRSLARLGRPADALDAYAHLESLLRTELAVVPAASTRALAESIRSESDIQANRSVSPARLPYVGRTKERAIALEYVEQALAGRCVGLAVEGPPGIGKSRLWEEIAAGARWRGATVLVARAVEYPTGSPLDPLRELLSQALHGPRSAQIELMLPAETMASLGELYPPWLGRAALPELPPPQAHTRLVRSLTDVFLALADMSPHILVLDDLHWAAPALWDVVAALFASASGSRLLIGMAYRRPDIEHSDGWRLVQQWERTGRLAALSLDPLPAADVAVALPEAMRAHADTVAAVSGGNPFYIIQAIFALQEGVDPAQVDRIVPDRIAMLPPGDREALAEASVLGPIVPFQLWSAISELDPAPLIEAANRLVDHYFLTPVDRGYAFAHQLIRKAVYEGIAADRRRLLHERAAAAVGELDSHNAHATAFHLDHSGQAGAAAAAYRAAGKQDLATFSFAEALAAFERAMELWPDNREAIAAERIETLFDIAGICDSIGNRDRQLSALRQAQEYAHLLENDAFVMRAFIGLGRLAAVTGDVDNAAVHLDAALALAGRVDDAALHFEAHFYRGDLAARSGRLDAAHEQFQSAYDLARSREDTTREARALRGLGIVARLKGNLSEALDLIERALALQTTGGDLFGASVTWTNRLAVLYDLGSWDRLLAQAVEALALKERLGDRHGAAIIRHMQGLAACSLGDFDRAAAALTMAEQEFIAVQDRRTAGLARNVLGLVAESEGRLDDARQDYEAALDRAEATGATTEAAYARHDLGALLARSDRPLDAVPLLEAAQATWQEQDNDLLRLKSEAWLGLALMPAGHERAAALADGGWAAFRRGTPRGEMPQSWLWALHRLLAELGRSTAANAVLRAANAELERQAGAIQDAALRRAFFGRVPLNHDIIAAYDAMTGGRRQVTLRLARADAPVGRPLTDADFLLVIWTVAAPGDGLIDSPSERRRHILQRLLDEAAAQGVAPTDDDLAAALGVSRRTILRDIQRLAGEGTPLLTRRRM